MMCTVQLGGPVPKAFGRVQYTPFQLADKSPMITDQHTAGGSISQLSQLAKLSPWLTLSTKGITSLFCHYKKWFCFFLCHSPVPSQRGDFLMINPSGTGLLMAVKFYWISFIDLIIHIFVIIIFIIISVNVCQQNWTLEGNAGFTMFASLWLVITDWLSA